MSSRPRASGPSVPGSSTLGRWSECHVSLPVRELWLEPRASHSQVLKASADARAYNDKVGEFVEELTTRLLIPGVPVRRGRSPPAIPLRSRGRPLRAAAASGPARAGSPRGRLLRPIPFGQLRLDRAWVRETLLIDLPRGGSVPDFLALVAATTGKPAEAGADPCPGRRYSHPPIPLRTGDHARSDLTRDPRPAPRGPWCPQSLDAACPGRPHRDRRRHGLGRLPATR